MRAEPRVEVGYRGRTVPVVAREAQGDERDAVWACGCQVYAGYQAYAHRIDHRPIHVLVLEPSRRRLTALGPDVPGEDRSSRVGCARNHHPDGAPGPSRGPREVGDCAIPGNGSGGERGRRIRVSTSAVAVILSLAARGSDAVDHGDSATFISPVYGYSISHQPSWSVTEASRALSEGEPPATSSGATDILGRDASDRVSTMQLPGVIIAAQPVANHTRIEQWESSIVDTVESMKQCGPPNGREDIKVDGEPGILLTYRGCPPDLGYLHLWAGVIHDGRGFHIVWFNTPGHEDEDRSSFEQMLSSMVFDE